MCIIYLFILKVELSYFSLFMSMFERVYKKTNYKVCNLFLSYKFSKIAFKNSL